MSARAASCHCLCPVNHPSVSGVCAGTADTSLRFDSPLTGEVDVQMCSACAAATLTATQEKHE